MKVTDIQIGHFYTVAGMGPMKVTELPDATPLDPRRPSKGLRKRTITLQTPGGNNYWAMPDELIQEVHEWWFDIYKQDTNTIVQTVNNWDFKTRSPFVKAGD